MRLKIKITTPPGLAKSTEPKIKPFILGLFKRIRCQTTIDEKDEVINWIIEAGSRDIDRIMHNLIHWQAMTELMLKQKPLEWVLRKVGGASKEQLAQVREMITQKTKIELVGRELSG
jgi:hypothetical protein